jgi:dTDP-4-dehydrorhamnose 3,5-epimerase
MQVRTMSLPGVLLFLPTPHHDDRGLFTRTFDTAIAAEHGLDGAAFLQDSQSRSRHRTVRGLHGRTGRGEAKLVRCARGAVFDVLVDARPGSPTFGEHLSITLDDTAFAQLYVPAGLLHGFQVLSETADVCYRIDREHDANDNVTVRFDDPDLGVDWPLPVGPISADDAGAGSWATLAAQLTADAGLVTPPPSR